MSNETLSVDEVLAKISQTIDELSALMSAVDDEKINTVPFEGSWTPPQLLRHLTKSMNGLNKALDMEAKPADRDPGLRSEDFKKFLLDFDKKLQQPVFLIPEERAYEKQAAIDELKNAFSRFKENAQHKDLKGLVEGLPFGPATKLEIVHFVLFHNQRHLEQMKKICAALGS